MSRALIQAQIKIIMESVDDIGVVHDYQRYRKNWADMLKLMTAASGSPPADIINGWCFWRKSTAARRITMGKNGQIEQTHTFKMRGIRSIDDEAASEKAFQDVCDAIFDKFEVNEEINSTCFRSDLIEMNNVDITEQTEFNADDYHIAELTLTVYERV